MKKSIPIIPLIISLALGAATFIFVLGYLNDMNAKQKLALEKKLEITKMPEYKIIIAKAPIGEYGKFSDANIEVITLKGEVPPKNVFNDPKELVEKFALKDIVVGNVIQKSDVIGTARPKSIQDVVPSGMRAVSIKIKDTVLDFVKPGDKVDLLADFTDSSGEKYTKIVLQNVLVLAKGNRIDNVPTSGDKPNQNTNSDLLTFALTIKQAEAITALTARTALKVAWRANKDNKIILTEGTTAKYLIGEKDSPEELFKSKFVY